MDEGYWAIFKIVRCSFAFSTHLKECFHRCEHIMKALFGIVLTGDSARESFCNTNTEQAAEGYPRKIRPECPAG